MSDLFVDNIKHQSSQGSGTITLGASGETVALASGASQTMAVNTPAFSLVQTNTGTTLTQNTYTKVVWDTEKFDTDSAVSSGRFTVPSGQAGKYFFTSTVSMQSNLAEINIDLYKNGSSFLRGNAIQGSSVASAMSVTGIIDLAVSDYVEVYVKQSHATNSVESGGSHSHFHGYKIIE